MERLFIVESQLELPGFIRSDSKIEYQKTLARLRRAALLFRRRVLSELVDRTPEELTGVGVELEESRKEISGVSYLFRDYKVGGLTVAYYYPEAISPEDAVIASREKSGQKVEIGVNRLDHIQLAVVCSDKSRTIHSLTLSPSLNSYWCDITTSCSNGDYERTVTPASSCPGIVNETDLIRRLTYQAAEILS